MCTCEKEASSPEFPDVTFLGVLIREGVDEDEDGIISSAEAEAVRSLDISYSSIEDTTGISAFVNLDTLICNWNHLTSLDVSRNTKLVYLDCSANQLTSLDLSENTGLTILLCDGNKLTSLDVSNNTLPESGKLQQQFICHLRFQQTYPPGQFKHKFYAFITQGLCL